MASLLYLASVPSAFENIKINSRLGENFDEERGSLRLQSLAVHVLGTLYTALNNKRRIEGPRTRVA